MYAAIAPHVKKHYIGLEVVGIDVLFSAYLMGGQLQSGYVFLMTVRGALLGRQHYITNVHILTPSIPPDDEIEVMLQIITQRLREAKAAQGNGTPT
jgi:hypothetical protein